MMQQVCFLALLTKRCSCIDEHRFVDIGEADSLDGLLQDINGSLETLSVAQNDRLSYSPDILVDT